MAKALSRTTLRRLDIQGFDGIDEATLGEVGRWLRLAFALCTASAALGTVMVSPVVLWALIPIAVLAAAFPVHPFDLIYNHGIRYLTRTVPLPRRGAPSRFACGLGAVWLLATAWALGADHLMLGYVLGGSLVVVGLLVSTIDLCIPSMIYRGIFGSPRRSAAKS
jgi:hypothetical protein